MRVKIVIVVFSLFCLLVDPVLAETLQVAKVYRDYPGYINPAVCENPNVSKSPAAPAPQIIVVPLPVIPETAAGTSVKPVNPVAVPAPAVEPAAATSQSAASPVTVTPSPASSLPAPAPVANVDPLKVPTVKTMATYPVYASLRDDNPVNVPYLSLWAGMVATHDVDVEYNHNSTEVPIDNGFAGGAAVGYDFGPVRLEIEGSYRDSNAEEGDADLKVRALMANVYADFNTGGTATPYLGAGVGVADVDVEHEDDQVLAGQVAAGILFAVTEKVAIDLGYRFMMTDDPDINGAELELRQHTALLGVQIRF